MPLSMMRSTNRTTTQLIVCGCAGSPVLVCGDFNSTPGDPVHRLLTQGEWPEVLQLLSDWFTAGDLACVCVNAYL